MTQTSNFLQNNQFQLVIPSFETTRFLSTSFQIPSVQLPNTVADSPFSKMKLAGDKIDFEPLQFEFIVDEAMNNYEEVYNWLMSIGYVEDFDHYKTYAQKSKYQPLGEQDIQVIVLDSKENPIRTFTFFNAVPTALQGMEFDAGVNDIQYIRSRVTFAYDYFTMDKD